MTDQEIAAPGPAFAAYPRRFRGCFRRGRTATHSGTDGRGLLSDLPRTSVEPIAPAAGTAVRTPREFPATAAWGHDRARDVLRRHLGEFLTPSPADPIGTVGVTDETSGRTWGGHTPGVRRQYLGCVGKIGRGIATARVGVARGTFRGLLDADLYLPESRDADRARCRAAGIPEAVTYRPTWRIAPDPSARVGRDGVRFTWPTFDEGYGAAVPFLRFLDSAGRKFAAEVPVSVAARDAAGGRSRRADARLTAADATAGRRHRVARRTARDAVRRSSGRSSGRPAGSTSRSRRSTRRRPRSRTSGPTPRANRSPGCRPRRSGGPPWDTPPGERSRRPG
jgi:SRSO17 transposase